MNKVIKKQIVMPDESVNEYNETENNDRCFRLVYDGSKVILFCEANGFTATRYNLFIGTEAECRLEAEKLNLELSEPQIMELD